MNTHIPTLQQTYAQSRQPRSKQPVGAHLWRAAKIKR